MATIAQIGSIYPGCPGGMIEGLSPKQLMVLHGYLHAVISQTYEAYEDVPADRADKVIAHFLEYVLQQHREGGG